MSQPITRISGAIQPPYVNPCIFGRKKDTACNAPQNRRPGVNYDFLELLLRGALGESNFQLSQVHSSTSVTNLSTPPTSWLGDAGRLARGEADASLNFLYPSDDLLRAMDFSHPLLERSSVLVIAKDKGSDSGHKRRFARMLEAILQPMESECWWALAAVTLPALLLLNIVPVTNPLHTCIKLWLKLEYLFVSTVYMTLKVQHLAAPFRLPFRSYDEYVQKAASSEAFFATTSKRSLFVASSLFADLYPSLAAALGHNRAWTRWESREEVLDAVEKDPRLGAIVSDASFRAHQAISCGLHSLPVPGAPKQFLVIPLRKHSRLSESVQRALSKDFSVASVYDGFRKRYLHERLCPESGLQSVAAVSIGDAAPSAALLAAGLFLCALEAACETLIRAALRSRGSGTAC